MTARTYVRRSLLHYRGIHVAVIAGVATAVAVLAGSLAVGDSVRFSLRQLVNSRLGATRTVISSTTLFREKLADSFPDSAPMMILEGIVTADTGGRRANGVAVYGVNDRFWKFHGVSGPARDAALGLWTRSDVAISEALARDMNAKAGDTLLVRVEQHSDIPREFLQGRRENSGRTMRMRIAATLGPAQLGEFSLRPQQGAVRAVFAPLDRLQRDLKLEGKVNTILLKDDSYTHAAEILRQTATLEDLGLKLRPTVRDGIVSLEKQSTLIDDSVASAVRKLNLPNQSFFTYLVNTIRVGDKEIPYSLVTAEENPPADGLVLNQWAADDLGISKPGATATLEYFVWREGRGLVVEHADIPVAGIVPITAGDRDMAPEFPGITESARLADWDPPFPLDLNRVRKKDEDYWDRYRATPKAFLPLRKGQELWGSRFGNLTSIRLPASPGLDARLRAAILSRGDPARAGVTVYPVRAQGMEASRGATDFGEYFVYFSFFLVVSAMMLAGLFFKLGLEQRAPEIGILRTLGFSPRTIRKLFVRQGMVLAAAGGVLGMVAAYAYAWLVLEGLRTFWIGAVGTTALRLHVGPVSLSSGFAGGIAAAQATMLWTLRGLGRQTPRALVTGSRRLGSRSIWMSIWVVAVLALIGAAMLGAAALGKMDQAGGFFGSASLFLIALLRLQWIWLARGTARPHSMITLGFRNASFHPGRAILCIALIASATFVIVAMDAFRRQPAVVPKYPLIAESQLPIYDRADLPARAIAFRLRPGDDTSCLNLYEPRNPRILGAPADFPQFAAVNADAGTGPIPAIADANSMTYVLHKKIGDEIVLPGDVHLKFVGTLEDSVFQSEIIISEKNFLRAFPDQQGYRVFLIDAAVTDAGKLDQEFSDYGFDATSTADRLASFHRVENTYLSTFQALGGLGLILGTVGLGAVLLRNVLEQRRELALLRAVGYRRGDLASIVLAENTLLLVGGLLTGTLTALLAVLPALSSRGGHISILSWTLLLPGVLVTGLAASFVAVAAVTRLPVLATLRSE
jgi:ABC-type lipoprotein release transport system permease subunit